MKIDIIPKNNTTYKKVKYLDFQDPQNVFFILKPNALLLVNEDSNICIGTPIIQEEGQLIMSPISGRLVLKGSLVCIVNDYKENTVITSKIDNISHLKKDQIIEILTKNKMLPLYLSGLEYPKEIIVNFQSQNLQEYNNEFLIKEYLEEIMTTLEVLKKNLEIPKITLLFSKNITSIVDVVKKINLNYPLLNIKFVKTYYPYQKNYFYEKDKIITAEPYDILRTYFLLKNLSFPSFTYITLNNIVKNEVTVLKVKKNTSMNEIIKKLDLPIYAVTYYLNNLLLKRSIPNIRAIIIDEKITSVHLTKTKRKQHAKCINCGKCGAVCPLKLDPKTMPDCPLECGLCNYICPVNYNFLGSVKK